jgi:hypothetical protein
MAIQPIDLQTLFTQIDKVGKEQANLKEGAHIQASLQGVQIQKKTEERTHTVNESQAAGEGAERIKDRNARKGGGETSGQDGRYGGEASEDKGRDPTIFRDPDLGTNIDVSG